jgi:hypothetical protein
MFHWSIYRVFVLNNSSKREYVQIMIFVYICSTWGIFELKTRFVAWITRNDVNGVSLFHLSYLITLMAYIGYQRTTNVQIKYFMFHSSICRIFVPSRAWKSDSFQIIIFVYVCSAWGIFELKMRFESWKKKNDVNGECLFHISYLITLMAYLCSQCTPQFHIKYFMFDLSINRQFALNRGGKRDPIQIIIFVYVCSTWGIVELKKRFETWITRKDLNGVWLFQLPYLIIFIVYLCSQLTPHLQIKYFMFDW